MLNTLYLQTFLAVVESGNYSAAAERLHMSQPAVSQHIRALEGQLDDVKLFRRNGQHMQPTHAGEALVDAARELLALSARTEEGIRALRGQISGRVVVGCTASSGEALVPPLVAAFRAHYPAIAVTTTIAPIEVLLEWLEIRQVHILIIEESQRRRGWESYMLGAERLALLAPRGHALLHQEQVPPGMLRGEPLILPRAGTPLRRLIEDGLRRRGIGATDMTIALECDAIGLTLEGIRDGLGLGFVPQSRIPRGREIGVVDLAGMNLQQDWFVVRPRERGAPRALQELFAFMCSSEASRIVAKDGLKRPAD